MRAPSDVASGGLIVPRTLLGRARRRLAPLARGRQNAARQAGEYDQRYPTIALDRLRTARCVRDAIDRTTSRQTPGVNFSTGRLGVIIPVRNREHHLIELQAALVPALQAAGIEHRIYIVEQVAGLPFNKGQLFNAGARCALESCDYLALHDVDFLPLEASYARPDRPLRPFGSCLHGEDLRPLPDPYFGGVVLLPAADLAQANGFSNHYWHWGKEDDDFLLRVVLAGRVPCFDRARSFSEDEHPASRDHQPDGSPPRSGSERRALRRLYLRNRARFRDMARGLHDPAEDGLSTLPGRIIARRETGTTLRLLVEPQGMPG